MQCLSMAGEASAGSACLTEVFNASVTDGRATQAAQLSNVRLSWTVLAVLTESPLFVMDLGHSADTWRRLVECLILWPQFHCAFLRVLASVGTSMQEGKNIYTSYHFFSWKSIILTVTFGKLIPNWTLIGQSSPCKCPGFTANLWTDNWLKFSLFCK